MTDPDLSELKVRIDGNDAAIAVVNVGTDPPGQMWPGISNTSACQVRCPDKSLKMGQSGRWSP
jgi:hypothetical protein